MSQPLSLQNIGLNQTLLELIYALKGLAQTVELYHTDLSRILEDDVTNRQRELRDLKLEIDRIREITGKSNQNLAVLPITLSDRMEKLIERIERGVDRRVESSVSEVHQAIKDTQHQITGLQQVLSIKELPPSDRDDTSSRIEVSDDGLVQVSFHKDLLKKVWAGFAILGAGAGGYGIIEGLKHIFGW